VRLDYERCDADKHNVLRVARSSPCVALADLTRGTNVPRSIVRSDDGTPAWSLREPLATVCRQRPARAHCTH